MSGSDSPPVGLLLAAGGGSRLGRPKATLLDGRGVPLIDRAVGALLYGGCGRVIVVLGAEAESAQALLADAGWTDDDDIEVALADDWADGLAASFRCGLDRAADTAAVAAVVTLVDTPGANADVVRRLTERASAAALARATFDGVPGHPVLIGREHWPALKNGLQGDAGARDYLLGHDATEVECADVGSGADLDTQADVDAWQARTQGPTVETAPARQ